MKTKTHKYKGWTIKEVKKCVDGQEYTDFECYTADEWTYGEGFRTVEHEASSLQEAKEFIDCY